VRIKVPTDIDRPDQIVWGLTARQLLILGVTCMLAWALYLGLRGFLPLAVIAVPSGLVVAAGTALAVVRPDGVLAERWLAEGIRHLLSARKRVMAPEGIPEVSEWARSDERTEPVDTLARAIDDGGVIDVGRGWFSLVCRASSINLVLRSEAEQEALIEGLGNLLNALDGPVSFVVRSERMDLRPHVEHIENNASGLPSVELEAAAHAHAAYLAYLASRRDVLRREVYLVLTDSARDSEQAASMLRRRAEQADVLLRSLGIRIDALDGQRAAALLARASDPDGPLPLTGLSLPAEIVRGAAG